MDRAAFTQALRPLLPRSAGYARALLGERKDAEDAVQQAALRAWAQRARYDVTRPFKPWWYAVLRNQCLDMLRHRARMPVMTPVEQATLATAPDESALDRAVLAASLARLPDAQREILLLRYFGELDYAELATLLAIPKGTVMSRLHQARKALATLIVPEEPRP